MRILPSAQNEAVDDRVGARFAMAAPILEATVYSLARQRLAALGGLESVTVWDLARELRAGSGDAGICFEYAVHEAIARRSPLVEPLASEILEKFCNIRGGAQSILFGPEKEGVVPILESVENALTEDSRVFVGNRGRPPKLKKHIRQIIRAYRVHEERTSLPRSISGLWKADLFVGSRGPDAWVGTTVKINPRRLEPARGLRIAIYPRSDLDDVPRLDDALNLIRMPLPYDAEFMELFYATFNLVRAFIRADARVPGEVELPYAEDRYVARELEGRRMFAVADVVRVLRDRGQPGLLLPDSVKSVEVAATLSEVDGLTRGANGWAGEFVSIAPRSRT
jgi:hypothetical protein